MESKTTFTKPRRMRQAGFTLVEVLVTAGLSGLFLAVVCSLSLYTSRSIASVTNSVDMSIHSRHAIDGMSKKLRQSTQVTAFSSNSISVIYDSRPLSYTYDARSKSLVENEGGKVTTLLENCDQLAFALYQRNPVTNSFNQFPVLTKTNEAKVIQVNWNCSRTLLAANGGSAEMVSSKIVLRTK